MREMKNTFGELLSLIKSNRIEEFIEQFPGNEDLTLSQMVKLKILASNENVTSVINDFITKKYRVDETTWKK